VSPGFLRDSGTFGKAKDLTNIKDVREEDEDAEIWREETGDKST